MSQESRRDRRPKAGGFEDRLRLAARLLLSVLREIFDESAYTRFLDRNRVLSSPTAYAAFSREHEVAKARRPRCC
jgi:hypothetical protein